MWKYHYPNQPLMNTSSLDGVQRSKMCGWEEHLRKRLFFLLWLHFGENGWVGGSTTLTYERRHSGGNGWLGGGKTRPSRFRVWMMALRRHSNNNGWLGGRKRRHSSFRIRMMALRRHFSDNGLLDEGKTSLSLVFTLEILSQRFLRFEIWKWENETKT